MGPSQGKRIGGVGSWLKSKGSRNDLFGYAIRKEEKPFSGKESPQS